METFDTAELAEYLADHGAPFSGATLRSWRLCEPRRGPAFYRIEGHSVRYSKASVDAWLAENTKEVGGSPVAGDSREEAGVSPREGPS